MLIQIKKNSIVYAFIREANDLYFKIVSFDLAIFIYSSRCVCVCVCVCVWILWGFLYIIDNLVNYEQRQFYFFLHSLYIAVSFS